MLKQNSSLKKFYLVNILWEHLITHLNLQKLECTFLCLIKLLFFLSPINDICFWDHVNQPPWVCVPVILSVCECVCFIMFAMTKYIHSCIIRHQFLGGCKNLWVPYFCLQYKVFWVTCSAQSMNIGLMLVVLLLMQLQQLLNVCVRVHARLGVCV